MWEQEILKMVFETLFPWPIIVFLIIGVWLYSTFRKASEGKLEIKSLEDDSFGKMLGDGSIPGDTNYPLGKSDFRRL